MKWRAVAALWVVAALPISGCAGLLAAPSPELDTYELTIPVVPTGGPARPRTQLLVAEPSALRALDGENIVVRTSPSSIEFLAGAQWADRLPRIVQARLVDAFQASGRLGGVGKPGEGLAIDFQVVSDVRAFEIRVFGQPRASIEISARLLNDRNGVVRATRVFAADSPVAGTGNDAYVAALDRAYGIVAADIVNWALGAM